MARHPIAIGGLLASHLLAAPLARAEQEASPPPAPLREMSMEELFAVPVTVATKTEVSASETPAAVYVVTDEQIKERGYRTLIDALADLPGFDIVHVNGTYPELVNQRGLPGNNQRALVYVDGILDNNIFEQAALGQTVRFPLSDVKRIEVLSGPASALYGANAFNGVINIVTKDGATDPGGHVATQGGLFYKDRFGGGANVAKRGSLGSEHPFAYALSGYIYRTAGPSYAGVEGRDEKGLGYYWSPEYTNSRESTYNVLGRFSWRNLRVETLHWEFRQGEGTFSNGNQQIDTDHNGNYGSAWDFSSHSILIGYLARLGTTLSLDSEVNARHTAVLYSSRDAYRNNPDLGPAYANQSDLVLTSGWGRKDYSAELKERLIWEPSRILSTMIGAEGLYINVPLDYARSNPTGERIGYGNVATWVQQIVKPASVVSFTGGFRLDHNTLYGSSFTPRLNAVFNPVEDLTVRALFGTGFRGPTAWEVHSSTPFRLPNTSLRPERLVSAELGVGYLLKKRYSFGVQTYFNELHDLIVNDVPTTILNTSGIPYNQNRNAGDAQIFGVELKTDLRLHELVSVNGNYTFSWGRYRNLPPELLSTVPVRDSDRIPNIARHHANAGVTFHPLSTLSLNVRFNYVGPRETIASNAIRMVDGYFLLGSNVRWSRAFAVEGLYLDLLAMNLLNVRGFDPGIRNARGDYYPTQQPIPPLNVWLTLGYEF